MERTILMRGGVHTRTVGSHKRFEVTVQVDGRTVKSSTSVPQHPGDIPTGTLFKIERDLAPALGRRWLTR